LLKMLLEAANLISIALNSFQALGKDMSGCLEVEINLELGTNKSRAFRREGPSLSSRLPNC
jgi:hypothetical protein